MNKATTKKMAKERTNRDQNGMRKEYHLDYAVAKPNRFAGKSSATVVMLEADVAKVFHDGAQVNAALRAIINAVPTRKVRSR